jgi:hypothetical protein
MGYWHVIQLTAVLTIACLLVAERKPAPSALKSRFKSLFEPLLRFALAKHPCTRWDQGFYPYIYGGDRERERFGDKSVIVSLFPCFQQRRLSVLHWSENEFSIGAKHTRFVRTRRCAFWFELKSRSSPADETSLVNTQRPG